MFYTYSNNCVENSYLVIEALSQEDADTKAATLGAPLGIGHRQWTAVDHDNESPTVNGTVIAVMDDDDWVSTESGVHGQVVYGSGKIVVY